MKRRIEILKLFLGDYLVLRILDLKIRWFPTKTQKEGIEKEFNKRKQFYGSFIKQNDLCFDVGANTGNRVLPFLDIGARVVAVEPQESCCKFLRQKFGGKIEIVHKGLGERECIKDFYISSSITTSSFSIEWINSVKVGRFKDYRWNKVIKVEMTTLDRLIEKYGLPVFIKIDVEGYELEVLKGLTKPIKVISFEYTVPEQISKVIDCIEQVEKNNSNIECNYSIGESMIFALKEWQSVDEIKRHLMTQEFIDTRFGDVYIKIKN